jgi:hypothetical protein
MALFRPERRLRDEAVQVVLVFDEARATEERLVPSAAGCRKVEWHPGELFPRQLFAEILRLIAQLRSPPAPVAT